MSGVRRRSVALIGAVSVCVGGLSTGTANAAAIRVSVSSNPVTRPLPGNFLGLALEYNTIPRWVGSGRGVVNPVLIALIKALDPDGRTVLRIGGQSTDRTWWPVPGMARPLGVTYDLGPNWTTSARALAAATGARLLIGLNLESNRRRIPEVEAQQLLPRLGRQYVEAFAIGNEPDLYPVMPWYRTLNGHPIAWYSRQGTPVFSRASTYGPQQYLAEVKRTLRVLPDLPIAGPETSQPDWLAPFSALDIPGHPIATITSHAYALSQCITGPASLFSPSVPNLLSTRVSRHLLDGLTPFIALAHRRGETYRVDEMGSISCNGRAGVSNSMASALWLIDSLFAIARAGADGVNLHTYPNSVNGLFDFTQTKGVWTGVVHPLYYGALMFAQAAPAGSRQLTTTPSAESTERAWATLGSDRDLRVMLLNDALRRSIRVRVRLPARYANGAGTLEQLSAASPYATRGVKLGGQSFPDPTVTGVLAAPSLTSVTPDAGTVTVTLPAGSAALLNFPPRG